jgi:hypothetical protein
MTVSTTVGVGGRESRTTVSLVGGVGWDWAPATLAAGKARKAKRI